MGIWVEPESIFQYENIYRPRHTVPSIISLAPRGGDLPSTVSHFLAGATLALPFTGVLSIREAVRPAGLMFSASLLAAAPDLDTISFGLIPYGHFFGHRGFFHSPFFAICSALTLSCLLFALSRSFTIGASLGIAAAFALAIASHGILDAMTKEGLIVMLLYPFSDERIFFSWRLFHSPLIKLSNLSWLQVRMMLKSEYPIVLVCVAIGGTVRFVLGRTGCRGKRKAI